MIIIKIPSSGTDFVFFPIRWNRLPHPHICTHPMAVQLTNCIETQSAIASLSSAIDEPCKYIEDTVDPQFSFILFIFLSSFSGPQNELSMRFCLWLWSIYLFIYFRHHLTTKLSNIYCWLVQDRKYGRYLENAEKYMLQGIIIN